MFDLIEKESPLATFNFVVTKLREQGKPSTCVTPSGSLACAYINSDGCRCAIGHLFPDSITPEQGRNMLGTIHQIIGVEITRPQDLFILVDLQKAHDTAAFHNFEDENNILKLRTATDAEWCKLCAEKCVEVGRRLGDPRVAQAWLESLS